MAMFVHLTPESRVKNILRNGISRTRKWADGRRVIFAMPVTRNFYISHQWLRELKRGRAGGPFVGIYFRIPDEERVLIGHYNQAHQEMSAAEASAAIMQNEFAEGFEVLISRRIQVSEIHRCRELPQVLGWRYYPNSHGQKPCTCSFCQSGTYGGRKIRERSEAD